MALSNPQGIPATSLLDETIASCIALEGTSLSAGLVP